MNETQRVHLTHLSLTNFRNYSRLELDLTPGTTLLQGANAQGKTNFLEAIAYLSTSRSLLSTTESELVNWLAWEDEPLPFARLVGNLSVNKGKRKIEITLVQANGGSSGGSRLRKEVRVNGATRRAIDLIGQMPAVVFLPQDIELIAGSPSIRRRYMDMALCQMQPDYCRALSAYNKVVQQRNALLKVLRERNGSREQLAFWDEQLTERGSLLVARRAAFLADLEYEANQHQRLLTGGQERLHVLYAPSLESANLQSGQSRASATSPLPAHEPLDGQAIAAHYAEALRYNQSREIAAGMSLLGPHRDDVQFVAEGRDLRTYGSRGQQRTAALSAKLAELALMRKALGVPPLLLLDDVMSELDSQRRALLLDALNGVEQALVTTTDWGDFTLDFRRSARCLHVVGGRIVDDPGATAG